MVLGDCAYIRGQGQEAVTVLCNRIGSSAYRWTWPSVIYDIQERTRFNASADIPYLLQYAHALRVLIQRAVTGTPNDGHRQRRRIWAYVEMRFEINFCDCRKRCLLFSFFFLRLNRGHFVRQGITAAIHSQSFASLLTLT